MVGLSGSTQGSMSPGPSGGGLPAPKVQTFRPEIAYDPEISDNVPSSGSPMKITVVRHVKVTLPGLPRYILDDLATFQPQVELLRFSKYNGARYAGSGRRGKESGPVHPANGLAPSGNGKLTGGGLHGGVSPTIQAIRQTEWPITSGNASIDVTRGMTAFMARMNVSWRDINDSIGFLLLPCPTSSRSRQTAPGKAYGYAKTYGLGEFHFRISVIDITDPRGNRTHGPLSEKVSLAMAQHPFNQAGLAPSGKVAVELAPTDGKMNFWIGDTTRLPG
jgi:hypothetical protein